MIIIRLIFLLTFFHLTKSQAYNVFVNTSTPLRTVSDRFLSFGLDMFSTTCSNTTWCGLNFTQIIPFSKALGPAYFRVGGTSADMTIFVNDKLNEQVVRNDPYNKYVITATQLDLLYNFINTTELRLIFDLNIMTRSGAGNNTSPNWNSSNAQDFLNYSSTNGYDMDFELGNEPSNYENANEFNYWITGEIMAQAFIQLRALLDANSLYKNSILIGPVTAGASAQIDNQDPQITKDFFNYNNGAIRKAIGACSWHYYYTDGNKATEEDFLNSTLMSKFYWPIAQMKNFSKDFYPQWLSETSSAYSGGGKYADKFIAGFLWLDKLGIASVYGLDVVTRWNIWGGGRGYSLLNGRDVLTTTPDFWLSLLYKKLVGPQVFEVVNWTQPWHNPTYTTFRLYAASSFNGNGYVLYGQNVENTPIALNLADISDKQTIIVYILTGYQNNVTSEYSALNFIEDFSSGIFLNWTAHQPSPKIQGRYTNPPVTIPPYSQFFIVFGLTQTFQCPTGWYQEKTITNKCVKIFDYSEPWFSAHLVCSTYGRNSTLWNIENAFEQTEILSSSQVSTSKCRSTKFMHGLIKNGSEWEWSNGSPNGYRNWANSYPKNDPTLNCAVWDKTTNSWYNVDCDVPQCYLCQIYL